MHAPFHTGQGLTGDGDQKLQRALQPLLSDQAGAVNLDKWLLPDGD